MDVETIRPLIADTSSLGYTFLTGGSRTAFASGMAVIEASKDMIGQLLRACCEDLGHPRGCGGMGRRRGAAGRRQRRGVRAAAARRPRRTRGQDRRADRRPRPRSTPRAPDPASGRTWWTWTSTARRGGWRTCATPVIQDARQGGASGLRGRADAGRGGAGHRLGAERGIRLRRKTGGSRTPASSTTASRSAPTCP